MSDLTLANHLYGLVSNRRDGSAKQKKLAELDRNEIEFG